MQPGKIKSVKRTKKVAAAPYVAKQPPKKETNPLIEKRPKNFGIGTLNSLIPLWQSSVTSLLPRGNCAAKAELDALCSLA